MSNNNLEQLAAAQKANADVLIALIRSGFNSLEKLAALNLNTARDFLNNSVSSAQTLIGAKDIQEAAKLQTGLAQPSLEKTTEYYRHLYELITQLQKDVTQVMEEHYTQLSQKAVSSIESTSAQAPVGGDVLAATLKSILTASSQAFENLTKAAKQVSEIADANIQAATQVTSKAVSSATAAAAKSSAKK